MDYSEIWYLGLDTKKIEGSQESPQNAGYDDEHGSYLKVRYYMSYLFPGSYFGIISFYYRI